MSSYDYQLLFDGLFGGLTLVNNLFSTAVFVLIIVARGFLFSKANEPAWATVVPFYNLYILFKIAGKKKMFPAYLSCYIVMIVDVIIMIVTILGTFLSVLVRLGNGFTSRVLTASIGVAISGVVLVGLSIAMIVLNILMCIGLAKSFGKGGGFACGLIFLAPIFYCIMAFSNDIVYLGPGGPQQAAPGAGYGYGPNGGQVPPQNMNYGGQVPPQNMNYGGQVPPQNMNYGDYVSQQNVNNGQQDINKK